MSRIFRKSLQAVIVASLGSSLWATGSGFLFLTWEANPEVFLAGYYVYRSNHANGPYERLIDEPIGVPQFQDFGVTPGQSYNYRVSAVAGDGAEGAFSETLGVQAPAVETRAPAGSGSTPVIEASQGQLVILSPQRIGVGLDAAGSWSQLTGPPVVLIPAGDGAVAFRVPAGGEEGLTFRYSVLGAEPGETSGGGGHSEVRVVGPARPSAQRR